MVTPADIMEYLEKVSDNTEIKTEEIKKILDNAQRDDIKLSDTERKNICGKENKRNMLPMAVYITSPDYLGNTADIEGISKVCEKYDIPVEQSLAFGDGQNDLDMLNAAGAGFAMANAPEEVKAAAPFVTPVDNEHQGLLAVLRKYFDEK